MKNRVFFKNIKNIIKYLNISAIFILTAMLLTVLSGLSGCGVLGAGSENIEELTFSSQDNNVRNDIHVDAEDYNATQTQTAPQITDEINPADETGQNQPEENTPEAATVMNQADTTVIPETAPDTSENLQNTKISDESDGVVRLSFLAAGDNIMHSNMIDDAKERAKDGEQFNFIDMYKDIADTVKAADISFVNVETPIAGDEFEYSGYPNFNTPKENGFALVDIGFDIVNLANNHMLDKWEKGYMNSINFWEKQPVLAIGGFKNQEDFENIRIYKKDGVSIAFLSYTYGTNGMVLPADSKMIIPLIDSATIERQIKAAKPLADLLFVVMHWGDEDSFIPNISQRSLAQMMVDNGVDAIIGMHPHVLQETKWAARPDGGKTLVAYSIGNMISGMLGAQNMVGSFLTFDIVKTVKGGVSSTVIENAQMVPIVTHYNMLRKAFQVYRFDEYTEELAKTHGNINQDNKFSYQYLKDLITKNIQPEFLSDFYKK